MQPLAKHLFYASNYQLFPNESCRKTAIVAISGSKLDRALLMTNPACENKRSAGAEVAGMHSSLLASATTFGYKIAFLFRQSTGLLYPPAGSFCCFWNSQPPYSQFQNN